MGFYVLRHGWYMQNSSVVVLFNMFATNGNIRCFIQNNLSGKITLQAPVLMTEYLVAVSLNYGWCNICYIFGFSCCLAGIEKEKWYALLIKRLII